MTPRFLAILGVPALLLGLGSLSLLRSRSPQAQQKAAPKAAAAPPAKSAAAGAERAPVASDLRTPWGDPDLQGVWNDATSTPLERPGGEAGKQVLDPEQAEEFQEQLADNLSRDRRDGGAEADVNRAYNEHWMDSRRLKVTKDHRTSLIVDPPDGRIPAHVAISPERQKRRDDRAAALARVNAGMPGNYTDFVLPIRCIERTDVPPYMPFVYNNDFQIVQSPGYVVIAPEMIHSARIIPVDGRPHIPGDLKQWLGDSRGRWEGRTLVIETINFRPDAEIFMGADPATLKLTERFTRVDARTISYEFTVEDPHTWSRPWTVRIPWNRIDPQEQMYEYACHEDNYDVSHFLQGARAREARGETLQPIAHLPANQ